jgi:predicted nucleic acid-binding protein
VARSDHTDVDCVAVAVLSHGEMAEREGEKVIGDRLVAHNSLLWFKELTEPLSEPKCHKSLHGKPKLFFIQVLYISSTSSIIISLVRLFRMGVGSRESDS